VVSSGIVQAPSRFRSRDEESFFIILLDGGGQMKKHPGSQSLGFRGVAMIATAIGAVAVGAFAIRR
jgi:hypothetical protein